MGTGAGPKRTPVLESDLDSRSGVASEALQVSRPSSGKWVQELKFDYDVRDQKVPLFQLNSDYEK